MQVQSGTSRRALLKAFAAGGAGALSASLMLGKGNSGRIDVHHHFQAPEISGPIRNWSPAISLAQMDKHSITTAMLSHPGGNEVICDGTEKGRALARRVNDFGAKIVSENPKRFGLLAALPMRDVDGCLREIEYALDTLKADGFGISSNNTETWPGDPSLLPVFQELHRRKAVVFIHPQVNKCCQNLAAGAGDSEIEYDCDTIRAITSLLYNGVLSGCPDVRFIVNHSGRSVPGLARRTSHHDGNNGKIPNGVFYELRKLFYECAHAPYSTPISALRSFVPASQLLFGTDCPAGPVEPTLGNLPPPTMPGGDGLSQAVLRAGERDNAVRMFPRLKL